MRNMSNLFYFGTTLYMFRTVCLSTIKYVIQVLWLLASKQPQNLYDIYLMLYIQFYTPDDGRRDRPKHVDCCSKIK